MGVWKNIPASLAAIIFATLVANAPADQALALSPQAADFLRSISIDPASENVKLADQDGTIKTTSSCITPTDCDSEEWSLETLAIGKKTNGVRCFIDTRAFIRRLKADSNRTEKIVAGHTLYTCGYQLYLTVEERKLAAKNVRY